MKGVNIVLGIVGSAFVGVIAHQFWIDRQLRELEALAYEIWEILEKDKVDEKFQEIVERFEDE